MTSWLWVVFTVLAAGGQTLRNAMQRELTSTIGTIGATHVRFLFGLPFALVFLTGVLLATGYPIPVPPPAMLAWTLVGAATQIAATAMLLAAMRDKSFVLITALNKIEPVHVALFGLVFLGDRLTLLQAVAIVIATLGVLVMSWPKAGSVEALGLKPIVLGLAAGAMFGASAVGYRGGILALAHPNFVVGATSTVVLGLLMQVAFLTTYLSIFDRKTLKAIAAAWRPSLLAGFMGAFASQMWFLAFALTTAAKVRTLALVEILFAGLVSRSLFKEGFATREGLGILLIVIGVAILLNQ
ncbi:MAG: DMT family transporter [Hyphomicrobiaceae bacterium]|nr:DMT family transporter [Hyphomicrobiaceae bacterium]